MEQLSTLQLFSTLFMVGLTWFVQIVHYPLFGLLEKTPQYFLQHQRRTGWVVLPVMALEGFSAGALFFLRGAEIDQVGFVLLVLIWLSTATLQLPCHLVLLKGYSERTVKRLVLTNWLRTALWSLRAAILLLFSPSAVTL